MKEKKNGNWIWVAWTYVEKKPYLLGLFAMLVAGILGNWFWTVGWEYLNDPSAGLQLGEPLEIAVRLALGVIAAALTFIPAYREIASQGGETWVSYLLAFQNGFFSPLRFASGVLREEAALDAVVRHFVG